MSTVNYLLPGSKEWVEFRRSKIGASDVPIICEKAPWSSPYELWQEKMGFKQKDMSTIMRLGILNEENARKQYEDFFGVIVFPKVVVHDKYPWLMASLDGLSLEGDTAVEIKSGPHSYELARKRIIPDYYQLQMLTQMECANLNSMSYWVWLPNQKPIHLKLERNPKIFAEILPALELFWKHIQDKTPPNHMEQREDETWCQEAKRYLEIRNQLKTFEKLEEEQRQCLIALAKDKDCCGGGVKLKKSLCKGRIDYSKIPELANVDLNKYRSESIQKWYLHEDLS